MSGLRFSIANLLTALAVVGVGLAALNPPSRYKALAIVILTASMLLVAAMATIYRGGDSRAFWLGVALFGWFYFIAAFTGAMPEIKSHIERPLDEFRRTFWQITIQEADKNPPDTSGLETAYDSATRATLAWPPWEDGFGVTLHCLVAWLFALAGGIVGRWLCMSSHGAPKVTVPKP
jgi:hypothetical protein